MKRLSSGALIALVVLLQPLAAPIAADMTSDRGLVLSLSCASCHGTNGKSPGSMPMLHGRSYDYLKSQLFAFKDSSRKGSVMNRIARGYSAAELNAIASYISSLK